MLLDLVSSTNNSILATATAATTFSKKASKLAKTGLTSLDKASSLSHGMVIKHTTQQNGIIEVLNTLCMIYFLFYLLNVYIFRIIF